MNYIENHRLFSYKFFLGFIQMSQITSKMRPKNKSILHYFLLNKLLKPPFPLDAALFSSFFFFSSSFFFLFSSFFFSFSFFFSLLSYSSKKFGFCSNRTSTLMCCYAVLCACEGFRRGRWGVRGSEREGSYLLWYVAEGIYHHTVALALGQRCTPSEWSDLVLTGTAQTSAWKRTWHLWMA